MYIVRRCRPRLSTRKLAACSSVPSQIGVSGVRRNSVSPQLSYLFGNPDRPPESSRSTAKTTDLSDNLRNSLESMIRHESYSTDVIDTLRQSSESEVEAADKKKKKRKRKKGKDNQLGQPAPDSGFEGGGRQKELASDKEKGGERSRLGTTSTEGDVFTRADLLVHKTRQKDQYDGWGPDRLSFTASSSSSKGAKGSLAANRPPVQYIRRVEGLLEEPMLCGDLTDLPPISEHNPIANLSHGLDRVLFNPGVHWLQDPRSGVYNFTPWLESIPKVNEFAFERLQGFISSSKDEDLVELAKREDRTFAGSTSSLTKILSHIYFLVSGNKEVNTGSLGQSFRNEPKTFTPGQRMPASVIFRYKDGVYAIDSDSGHPGVDERNILSWMGTLLEKFLTAAPSDFKQYLRSTPLPPQSEKPKREAYRYAKTTRFVMRSQLDCYDSRLPGTGVFDIKTRAVLPIRLDMFNHEENSGYLIRTLQGSMESFEKEYYDLIRSAFLKYNFQARIGNMDGVLVAYHNTARLFGFQYVPLEEMDRCLFGTNPEAGDRVFKRCITLMESICDEVIKCFPKQSVKCTFETLEDSDRMKVWVQPLEYDGNKEGLEGEGGLAGPIRLLEMTAKSYLGNISVPGGMAIAGKNGEPWSIYSSISDMAANEADIYKQLEGARDRQFRAWNIPAGMTRAELESFWDRLNFGAPLPTPEEDASNARLLDAAVAVLAGSSDVVPSSTFNPSYFQRPSRSVEALRAIARAGTEHSRKVARERAGKPIVMWGVPEGELGVYPEVGEENEDAQAVAEAVAVEAETAMEGDDEPLIVYESDEAGDATEGAEETAGEVEGLEGVAAGDATDGDLETEVEVEREDAETPSASSGEAKDEPDLAKDESVMRLSEEPIIALSTPDGVLSDNFAAASPADVRDGETGERDNHVLGNRYFGSTTEAPRVSELPEKESPILVAEDPVAAEPPQILSDDAIPTPPMAGESTPMVDESSTSSSISSGSDAGSIPGDQAADTKV